jgi:hypothetical protein
MACKLLNSCAIINLATARSFYWFDHFKMYIRRIACDFPAFERICPVHNCIHMTYMSSAQLYTHDGFIGTNKTKTQHVLKNRGVEILELKLCPNMNASPKVKRRYSKHSLTFFHLSLEKWYVLNERRRWLTFGRNTQSDDVMAVLNR